MKQSTRMVLLAFLAAGSVWGQEVTATSTTIGQAWKQNNGATTQAFAPGTEYLGIDASGLGNPGLSAHFYGWGRKDFGEVSTLYGRSTGDATYGYLQYDFGQANAQARVGRFTVTQGVSNEQMDGASLRTDLIGGFYASGFVGSPVVYKNQGPNHQDDIAHQHDIIFGGRLAWRAGKYGELGVSAMEDGSQPAYDLYTPEPIDYTRRQLGVDVRALPCANFDLSGRTVFDIGDHLQPAAGVAQPSRVAEHDYRGTLKLSERISLSGSFLERNLFAYYAGSTLPTLFNPNEQGMFKATGGSLTWKPVDRIQLTGDVRRTDREAFGLATRFGGDLRYILAEAHFQAGLGFHQVNAFSTPANLPAVPSPNYSLSHNEARAWVMASRGKVSGSLDALVLHYTDATINPYLDGKSSEYEVVGSAGYQAKENLKVSGDVTLQDTAQYGRQVLGLVRLEYRYGHSAQGGK